MKAVYGDQRRVFLAPLTVLATSIRYTLRMSSNQSPSATHSDSKGREPLLTQQRTKRGLAMDFMSPCDDSCERMDMSSSLAGMTCSARQTCSCQGNARSSINCSGDAACLIRPSFAQRSPIQAPIRPHQFALSSSIHTGLRTAPGSTRTLFRSWRWLGSCRLGPKVGRRASSARSKTSRRFSVSRRRAASGRPCALLHSSTCT